MQKNKIPAPPVIAPLLAHRGNSTEAPENTFASFIKTYQSGVRWIECDVQLIQDGTFVIIHDDTLDRVSNRTGAVAHLNAHQLEQIDVGSWFSLEYVQERIPLLEDFLHFIAKRDLYANLELKLPPAPYPPLEYASLFLAAIAKIKSIEQRLLLSSFNYEVLHEIRALNKTVPIALLQETPSADCFERLSAINGCGLHIALQACTPLIAEQCAKHNVALRIYTVNDPTTLVSCLRAIAPHRISGIFSDNPSVFLD